MLTIGASILYIIDRRSFGITKHVILTAMFVDFLGAIMLYKLVQS